MTVDPNRKTLRHFYCRDAIWHCYERMSEELDRGIDELVNEAMRVFAREKGYLPAELDSPRTSGVRPAVMAPAPPPAPQPRRPTPPPPPPPGRNTAALPSRPLPPQDSGPLDGADDAGPEIVSDGIPAPPLFLVFENQKYIIDKEQFIIGRGAKSSDLPIRDGNISRKHAAVIRRSGSYFIKDLGSTNGIDFNGTRIDNRRIDEGDVYTICDYRLKFTYR
jgi:pSer/pThr/pTyr-binding forkhead associated (FHA) protein